VTDYRTRVSGVEEKHMKNAQSLSVLQEKVKNAIAEKIVVGHGLKNDFQVLAINHPESMKRDTGTESDKLLGLSLCWLILLLVYFL
jgi:hypothetical protein